MNATYSSIKNSSKLFGRMFEIWNENKSIKRFKLAEAAGCSSSYAGSFLWSIRRATNDLEDITEEKVAEPVAVEELPLQEEHKLKTQVKSLMREVSDLKDRLAKELGVGCFISQLSQMPQTPPKWTAPKSSSAKNTVAVALLGDTHFDEVVFPEQIGGVNAYNREIAENRLKKFFESCVELGSQWLPTLPTQGIVIPMLGDMLTGEIHDELAQSNEASLIDSCMFWSDRLAAGIELLLSYYPNVHVPCVVGNHGRDSKKPRTKGRVEHNFDYLLYMLVAKYFANKKINEVTFQIPKTADCMFNIFKLRFLMTHGDQFKGGNGIAGIFSPLMLGDARKRKRQEAVGQGYDVMLMGHWHQTITSSSLIVNGSLKGYDEYAYISNFGYEAPQQSFFLVDSEAGITLRAPVHVKPKNESWEISTDTKPSWML